MKRRTLLQIKMGIVFDQCDQVMRRRFGADTCGCKSVLDNESMLSRGVIAFIARSGARAHHSTKTPHECLGCVDRRVRRLDRLPRVHVSQCVMSHSVGDFTFHSL